MASALVTALAASPAVMAQQATSSTLIGQTVTDPLTGVASTVTRIFQTGGLNYAVLTSTNELIYTTTTLGSVFPDGTGNWTVSGVHTNATTGLVDTFTMTRTTGTAPNTTTTNQTLTIANDFSTQNTGAAAGTAGAPPTPPSSLPPPSGGSGDANHKYDVRVGGSGSGGSDAYGFNACVLSFCTFIGVPGSDGSDGQSGPTFTGSLASPLNITTATAGLAGIRVASIGGNGGKGGDVYGGGSGYTGGNGGSGGNVTLNTYAYANVNVVTRGANAHGIIVQSRSGDGGKGGASYGIYGSGGSGGASTSAGNVTVNNGAAIWTYGVNAHAILAQSLAGSAGDGGSGWGLVGDGGTGAPGGDGGKVTVVNHGSLYTEGVGSRGIYAQSVGGSGGDGGSAGAVVSMGSSGGTGGDGAHVAVINYETGLITTKGRDADAIFAQSVGGGGGSGGDSLGVVSFGGVASSGGKGGDVTIENRAFLDASGLRARGIFAQSVGGGGGSGGSSGGAVSLGGNGGGASDGGVVYVRNVGDIATRGDFADAILAQSVGGGGGAGASSGGAVSLGGSGAGGAGGGEVSVVQTAASIWTTGRHARSIFAQSVGGGGGSGAGSGGALSLGGSGAGGGDGGKTTVNVSGGYLSTTGDGSDAIFAQSVGGGGGSGGSSGGALSLGGAGSRGGKGGEVSVTNSGILDTLGSFARGIFAQSVGGGGGSGASSGGVISLGGAGGSASVGGNVSVTNSGAISTGGGSASAIFAQSVGGGGGDGGSSGGVLLSMGGAGGSGALAGTVTVVNLANLETGGADAHGVFAQSLGGGGGNAGGASSGSLLAGVAIGGRGGSGGNGQTVSLTSSTYSALVGGNTMIFSPMISTDGDRARGILAQSIGGGGGNGGFAIQGSVGTIGSASVAIGGSGGSGGVGGAVNVDVNAAVDTRGEDADGILAQSVGGGGGNGGFAVSGTLQIATPLTGGAGAALSVALGGAGGSGSDGGSVAASLNGAIHTLGNMSEGLIAQSLGGGGGNGGFSVAAAVSGGTTGSLAVAVGIGGSAGSGGDAKTASGTVTGAITTAGDDAGAMLVQSVGGGGGNGGFNISAALSGAPSASAGVSVGVGGSGGNGGVGAHVAATVTGYLSTYGDRSAALLAQSVGGGGGNGGFDISVSGSVSGGASGALAVGIGGKAGGGGNAGTVTGNVAGDVRTWGDQSAGAIFQSIGGGGGNGGMNVSGVFSVASSGSAGLAVGVGGSGGGGGTGNLVDATMSGTVITGDAANHTGRNSTGILAQSVGGGGGNGGLNVSGTLAFSGAGAAGGAIGIGGAGGSGGTGGEVIAHLSSGVATYGDQAAAVVVQSVGGGGGNGGLNVSGVLTGSGSGSGGVAVGIGGSGGSGGAGGKVTATLGGDKYTAGSDSTAVTVQSVGGGGGNGGINVSGTISGGSSGSGALAIGVGGSGGNGGGSGEVTSSMTGNIVTEGDRSGGMLVQSVGGGGGSGGLNVSGSISLSGSGSGAVAVGVGGFGGIGGRVAGSTSASLTGDISTAGKESTAFIAQSVGGGGGNGGLNVSGAVSLASSGSGSVGIGMGGFGGSGGRAGNVTAEVSGLIETSGASSGGVLVQSAGGGGGNGGINISAPVSVSSTSGGSVGLGLGGFGGGGGLGMAASLTRSGDTRTVNDASTAITVQSVGGGGGNGGLDVTGPVNVALGGSGGSVGIGVGGFGGGGGNAGNVVATLTGNVQTGDANAHTGAGSVGIMAQSVGGGGGNGGVNVTGSVSVALGGSSGAGGIGVGGFGGSAGNSGAVSLVQTGSVSTQGANGHGVIAQSIAGGGGNGGVNVSGALSYSSTANSYSAALGVGGFGGGGGDAGNVTATVSGSVIAAGSSPDRVVVVDPVYLPPSALFTNQAPVLVAAGYSYTVSGENGSYGVVAQSIGGGGGNGGINVSGGIAATSSSAAKTGSLVLGIGGFGGAGGNAGKVDLTVNGSSTSSSGNDRAAILAQSLGGGGGNGAINVSGGIVSDGPLVAGVGGFGDHGGTADNVTVIANTNVTTDGNTAVGLLAQSIGGGGGNGGINVSGSLAVQKKAGTQSVTFGVGGFGGAGGISGDVTVTQSGTISTNGDSSHGLQAQSIGGGGGNGGLNVAGGFGIYQSQTSAQSTDFSIVAGIGGFAGVGTDAGAVSVTSSGAVTTLGNSARGVFAQSVGGGGGTGGINASGSFASQGSPIVVGIGGFGGGGGNAGVVSVVRGDSSNAAGNISTKGSSANAIEASSIGGGGGDAGMNFVVSVAGENQGSGGNTGGGASSTNPWAGKVDPSVITNFDAVLAEKFGLGSGGTSSSSTPASSQYSMQFAMGGSGGNAGNGRRVDVRNYSDLSTEGGQSAGIFAQSLGGGGGNVSYNIAFGFVPKARSAKVVLGGQAGGGGNGAAVIVEHSGAITTLGSDSPGVFAQSVGGGGGNASTTLKFTPESIILGVLGALPTLTSAGAVSLSLGWEGGTGGVGGDVTLDATGDIHTSGDKSYGLFAQSVGGGGGNSAARSAGLKLPENSGVAQEAKVSVGLVGGVGSHSGNVVLNAAGSVTTKGASAHALFAQSIGGGGGNGGTAITMGLTAPTVGVSLGGTGGSAAVGEMVTVDNSAELVAFGSGSSAILAQSIGGGGGSGGMALSGSLIGDPINKNVTNSARVSVGGEGGTGADGGVVSVSNRGQVTTFGGVGEDGNAGYGIFAQSLGGGGGNGGISYSGVLLNMDKNPSNEVSVAVGGHGGTGGTGGAVHVDNAAQIATYGDTASGILAQSVGGGGGRGGLAITGSVSFGGGGNAINLSIGGTGGTGGVGGDVTVNNDLTSGAIFTHGYQAHGIQAISLGGGGGSGALAISGELSLMSSSTVNGLDFSLGGKGGIGGRAGTVTVTNAGTVSTSGAGAHGIFAESVGGGGGDGGMSIAANVVLGSSAEKGINGAMAIGGFGGAGNVAGNVLVTNTGSLETTGAGSHGVFAQSVGGGGGNGAISVAAVFDATSKAALLQGALMSVGLGGFGGDGGNGGDVSVNNSGDILVRGANSYGIYAQSVAGGGGTGALSFAGPISEAVDLGVTLVGAKEGSNGTVGTVTVNNTGTIVTYGANSRAFFQQGVNGGGGDLRQSMNVSDDSGSLVSSSLMAFSAMALAAPSSVVTHSQTLGATGGGNNPGSAVSGGQTGDIGTVGENSPAFGAQSVGGGGGSSLLALTVNAQTTLNLQLGLGATNSGSNAGGHVDMTRHGLVVTEGAQSSGVSVQSIGGGGGSLNVLVSEMIGGIAATAQVAADSSTRLSLGANGGTDNHGGNVALVLSGDVQTLGNRAQGLMVQSVGAGGGETRLTGTGSAAVTLGGSLGAQGNGGDISLSNSGLIDTVGTLAHGVFIQSVGGGGGVVFSDLQPSAVGLTLNNGGVGNGGSIDVHQTGNVITRGARAFGAFVQSIGGGGGAIDTSFAGNAGGSGNGGDISLALASRVATTGSAATALFAQSSGGNGGGNVALTVNGIVSTAGAAADGIHAESLGVRGAGGNVDVALTGAVVASGNNSVGVLAQSAGGVGGGKITVDINSTVSSFDTAAINPDAIVVPTGVSLVMGGAGSQGAGIFLRDGVAGATSAASTNWNVINNNGIVSSTLGTDGYAVRASGLGSNRINNYGLMIGSINLGDAILYNAPGATLISGTSIDLGGTNLATDYLQNAGNLLPGGINRVMKTALNGNFVQDAGASLGIDLDLLVQTVDRVVATGAATVHGDVVLNTLNPGQAQTGTHDRSIVQAATVTDQTDLNLVAVSSAVATYSLLYPNPANIVLRYVIDYSPVGLTGNEHAVGNAINAIMTNRTSPAFVPMAAGIFNQPNVPALARTYNSMSGEIAAGGQEAAFAASGRQLSSIGGQVGSWLSGGYPRLGALSGVDSVVKLASASDPTVQTDALPGWTMPAPAADSWRAWVAGTKGNALVRGDLAMGSSSLQMLGTGQVIGIDNRPTPETLVGIALSEENLSYSFVDGLASGSTRAVGFSLYGAWQSQQRYIWGSMNYGVYENAFSRTASIAGVGTERLKAESDSASYGAQIEAGWRFPVSDSVTIAPFVDFRYTTLSTQHVTETKSDGSASLLGLSYGARNVVSAPLSAGTTFEWKADLDGFGKLRSWMRLAYIHETHAKRTVNPSFIAAPGYSFVTNGAHTPRDTGNVKVGATLPLSANTSIFANVNADLSNAHTYDFGAGISVQW